MSIQLNRGNNSNSLSTNSAGTTGYSQADKWSWTSYLVPCTKINSKMHQRPKAKTIKLLEDYIGVNLSDLRLGSGFLDMIQKAHST